VAIESKEQAPMMIDIAAINIIVPKGFFMMVSLLIETDQFSEKKLKPDRFYFPLPDKVISKTNNSN
jgi:hypothetical protein